MYRSDRALLFKRCVCYIANLVPTSLLGLYRLFLLAMVSAGTLIWISLRLFSDCTSIFSLGFSPVVLTVLAVSWCVSCGYAITRADIFPRVAAQGAGQIALVSHCDARARANLILSIRTSRYHVLMFSKMVPAFTSDNIGALGVQAAHSRHANITPSQSLKLTVHLSVF